MAVASIQVSETPLVLYALRRADDALILGHRLSEWCGHAPMLEEDMALANMGLDLLGQARELYSYAAKVEGKGNDEDKFAYLRDVRQYRNLLLLEQPNGDFARTMVRQFFYAAFADLYWRAMMKSSDPTLAAIAAKSEKESAYHLRHSSEWMVRLGDGTEESHRRAQTRDRRSLGLYRRDVSRRRQRARPDRCRHRDRSRRSCIRNGSRRCPASSTKRHWRCRKATGCSRAAATAGTASISAISSANCSRCRGRFRGRHGDRRAQRCRSAPARLGCGRASGRSRNSGADHRRSRRAARGRGQRRPCRGRDHADLFRLSRDEHDRAGNRAGAGARRHCASRKSAPCCRRPGPPTG